MTHLTILALGSRGDVLPYVVLGAGLQQSGFAVRVVTFESFAPQAASHTQELEGQPPPLTLLKRQRKPEAGQRVH
jgi:UDP:flavonoid glycosyltransferase YjiC (YdhE family)